MALMIPNIMATFALDKKGKQSCSYFTALRVQRSVYLCREKLTTPGDQNEAFDICSIEDCVRKLCVCAQVLVCDLCAPFCIRTTLMKTCQSFVQSWPSCTGRELKWH